MVSNKRSCGKIYSLLMLSNLDCIAKMHKMEYFYAAICFCAEVNGFITERLKYE